jgi:ammonia channel protein AmtB
MSSINSGDTAWLLISSALVMLMRPGLALFYGGMVRKKNALSTIMMSFVDFLKSWSQQAIRLRSASVEQKAKLFGTFYREYTIPNRVREEFILGVAFGFQVLKRSGV